MTVIKREAIRDGAAKPGDFTLPEPQPVPQLVVADLNEHAGVADFGKTRIAKLGAVTFIELDLAVQDTAVLRADQAEQPILLSPGDGWFLASHYVPARVVDSEGTVVIALLGAEAGIIRIQHWGDDLAALKAPLRIFASTAVVEP